MCGIVGLQHRDPQRDVSDDALAAMCGAIVHRGPDDEGRFIDGSFGMGMRRLAIIDLVAGRQPMFNEDGHIAVVFNGEIFNHLELRRELETLGHRFRTRSDTEVLVHGYEHWGDRLPERLNGMFAFCVWDGRRRRALVARDHIGVKPLYIYKDDAMVAWASEIKSLLTIPGIRAELDEKALLDFLKFGYVPAPRTMFRRIRKLEPATCVVVQEGEITHQRRYWDVDFREEHRSMASWCEELRSLVDDAVGRQLMSDVPLGAFLSGGIDSSAIVSTMRRLGVGNISTYAIGFGDEDAFHSELKKAASVARTFETQHHEIVVKPDVTDLLFPLIRQMDEPFTDTSFLVTYLVSKLARESVTVILSGVGGDEIFAGYRRYWGPRLQSLYQWVPGAVHRGVVRPLLERLPVDRGSTLRSMFRHARGFVQQADRREDLRYQGYVSVYDGDLSSVLSPELGKLEERYDSNHVADYYRAAKAGDPLNRMLYADLKSSLVDSLLAFTDKMSMAVSLEARVPLLDVRLVELAARIPPELKLRGVSGLKHIFKEAMRDRLPERVLTQKKQGFGTPISRWLRGSVRPLVGDLLSEQRLRRRGFFRPSVVTKLIEDHFEQRRDCSEHILALLSFEIWQQEYLD